MGAEVFHVCYGIRQELDADDELTLQALQSRRHPWQIAARQQRLDCWWGITTDEYKYFLLVGHFIGHFGWEGEAVVQLSVAEATAVVIETAERLRASGIEGQPAWHFQFEPDR